MGAVKVRTAVADDIYDLVELGYYMHQESPRYQRLHYSQDKVGALASRLIPTGGVFVAERDDMIIGMMAGFVTEHWFSGDLMASDFVLYLMPDERKRGRAAVMLFRAFEQWAIAKGAVDICPSTSTGVDAEGTARFYEKMGYARTGVSMFKRVRDV